MRIPQWMTDPIVCRRMVLVDKPHCNVRALQNLRQLMDSIALSKKENTEYSNSQNNQRSSLLPLRAEACAVSWEATDLGGNHESSTKLKAGNTRPVVTDDTMGFIAGTRTKRSHSVDRSSHQTKPVHEERGKT